MPRQFALPLSSALLLGACGTTPVAVLCPPPRPLPEVLTSSVTIGQDLMERYEALLKELRDSLAKAAKAP